jgi:hypothetical protein
MARNSTLTSSGDRKRRTREHVLEELSIHHIKGLVLRCGFSLEETTEDYGLDLWMQTYTTSGEVESDVVWMQVKAAESLEGYLLRKENCFSYPIETKDILYWTESAMPVYFILYDATLVEAYWLNTDEILSGKQKLTGKHKRLHVPRTNVVGVQTIRLMQEYKNSLVQWYRRERRLRRKK